MSHTIFLTLDVHWYAFWTLLENQSKYLSGLQIYHILWERKLWNIWAVCDEKCFLCKQSITWLQIMRGQDWAEAWSWLWFELSEARLHPASCNVGGVRDALTEKIAMIRDKWKYNRCSWKVVNIRSSQFSWILYILDVGLNSFLEAGVDLTTNIWYRCLVVQESLKLI